MADKATRRGRSAKVSDWLRVLQPHFHTASRRCAPKRPPANDHEVLIRIESIQVSQNLLINFMWSAGATRPSRWVRSAAVGLVEVVRREAYETVRVEVV